MALLRRAIRIDARSAEPGKPVKVTSSTDAPIRRGRYVEILSHEPGAMTDAAVSVLKNHNTDVIVGRIDESHNDGHKVTDAVSFAPTAVAQDEETLVRGGFVTGVSIGYTIDAFTRTEADDGTVTIRATAWTRRELSTTPTPADLGAGVTERSLGDDAEWARALGLDPSPSTPAASRSASTHTAAPAASEHVAMKMTAAQLRTLLTLYAAVGAEIEARADKGETFEAVDAWAKAEVARRASNAAADPEVRKAREEAEKAKRGLELVTLARSHGVDLSAEEVDKFESREAGLETILKRKAAGTSVPGPIAGEARVTADEADKVRLAAKEALVVRSGGTLADLGEKDKAAAIRLGVAGSMGRMRTLDIARRCAIAMGVAGAREWDDGTLADYASRSQEFRTRVYGVADFPNILANVAQVNLAAGFLGTGNTWRTWTRISKRRNTQSGKIGGIAAGRFGRPTDDDEKNPLPALSLADGGATIQAAMGGARTVITRGAILADELGEILRTLRQAGAIADDTIEADAFKALVDATMTGAITLSADLGASGGAGAAIAAGVADFMMKKDPANKPINARPRFILHAPKHVDAVHKVVYPTVGSADSAYKYLEPIISPYLASHPDTANENADDFFLAGDPNRIDGIVVGLVYDTPQIYDVDAGGVPGIGLLFEFPWGVTNVGTYGLQRCKKASS